MTLAALLLSLLPGSATTDTTSSDTRVPDYWEAWGVVFVQAECDPHGNVLRAEVVRGTAAPAVLDSLIALVKAGAFEIRDTLARFPLDVWLRGMLEIDPEFELGDFLDSSRGKLTEIPAPGPPSESYLDERREQGLYIDSPRGSWMLDLLANGDVEKTVTWDGTWTQRFPSTRP